MKRPERLPFPLMMLVCLGIIIIADVVLSALGVRGDWALYGAVAVLVLMTAVLEGRGK